MQADHEQEKLWPPQPLGSKCRSQMPWGDPEPASRLPGDCLCPGPLAGKPQCAGAKWGTGWGGPAKGETQPPGERQKVSPVRSGLGCCQCHTPGITQSECTCFGLPTSKSSAGGERKKNHLHCEGLFVVSL